MECLATSDMLGAMLLVFGVVANLFSLTFFVSRSKIGTEYFLYLCLDVLNILICLYLVGSIPLIRDTHVFHTAYLLHDTIVYLSLFLVSLISGFQMVNLLYPAVQHFFKIRFIVLGCLLFCVILTLPFIIQPGYFLSGPRSNSLWATYHSIISFLLIIVVIISCVLIVWALKFSTGIEITPKHRRSGEMALILGSIKVLFMTPYSLFLLTYSLSKHRNVVDQEDEIGEFLEGWSNYAMPVNSVIYVVIFFLRIRLLRTYSVRILKMLYKVSHCDCDCKRKTKETEGPAVTFNTPPPSPSAPQARAEELFPV